MAVLQEEVAEVPAVAEAVLDDTQIAGDREFIFLCDLVFLKS